MTFKLDAVEKTTLETTGKIRAIKDLMDKTIYKVKKELPEVYSKELVETLFEQPYCKIERLVEQKIAGRKASSWYLQALEGIGILDGKK